MNYILPAFIGLLLLTTACKKKKFTHDAAITATSCDLCSYADSLEGTYTGEVTGVNYPQPHIQSVTFEHIFLGFNSPIDSTTMFLRKTMVDSTANTTTIDTIAIRSRLGRTYDDEPGLTILTYYGYTTFHSGLDDSWQTVIYKEFEGVR